MAERFDPWAEVKRRDAEKVRADRLAGTVALLAGVLLLGYLVVLKGAVGKVFEERETIKVLFPNVNGLYEGDSVRFQGAKVGEVHRISLFGDKVLVELRCKAQLPLGPNPKFTIEPASVLGGRVVKIEPGGKGRFPKKRVFEGEGPVDILAELANLIERLNLAGPKAGGLLAGLSDLAKGIRSGEGLISSFFRSEGKLSRDFSQVKGAFQRSEGTFSLIFDETSTFKKNVGKISDALSKTKEENNALGILLSLLTKKTEGKKESSYADRLSSGFSFISKAFEEKTGSMKIFASQSELREELKSFSALFEKKPPKGLLPDLFSSESEASGYLNQTLDSLSELQKKLEKVKGAEGAEELQSLLSALTGFFGFEGSGSVKDRVFTLQLYRLLRFFGVVEPFVSPIF